MTDESTPADENVPADEAPSPAPDTSPGPDRDPATSPTTPTSGSAVTPPRLPVTPASATPGPAGPPATPPVTPAGSAPSSPPPETPPPAGPPPAPTASDAPPPPPPSPAGAPTWAASTGTTPAAAIGGAAGASVDPGAPTVPAPATSTTAKPRSGFRQFVVGVVVGGLVGGLVAGGVVVATQDDDAGRTTRVVERVVPATQGNNTSEFAKPADIQGVLAQVEPAVVAVTTGGATDLFDQTSQSGGAGTGFVVSPDGVIVTNNHVVEGADGQIEVSFSDGTKKKAKVLGSDSSIDLAVIKVDGENLPTAKLGDSAALKVGDQVIAIGNALALDGGPSVTQGIVSAMNRQIQEENGATLFNLLQTDAAINPGNSGGPLVNSNGEVVGINTAIADPSDSQNVGFAISISSVRDAIEQLRAGKSVRLPYLGVYTVTLTPAMANELGSGATLGAVVREVTKGSPADDAGIQKDDVIVQVGDMKVTSAEDVGTAVRQHASGDAVSVTVDRGGQQRTVEVTLGVRPSDK